MKNKKYEKCINHQVHVVNMAISAKFGCAA
jgi:hypothetical protein